MTYYCHNGLRAFHQLVNEDDRFMFLIVFVVEKNLFKFNLALLSKEQYYSWK